MSATAQYVVLLVVSVVATFAVGQFLIRAGEPFLLEVFEDRKVTRSLNLLLSVLFHLVTLGVLAIVSVVDIPANGDLQGFVVKLGVVLLVLGLAYGISMLVLLRVRAARQADRVHEHVTEQLATRRMQHAEEADLGPDARDRIPAETTPAAPRSTDIPQPGTPRRGSTDAGPATDYERV